MQERLAIVVLLLAAFSSCDLQTDQPGTKIDKNGNVWLDYRDAPDAQNTVADNEDFEVMLDPEADYKYFEHHGDYTLIKPKFWGKFRNGGRTRRLVNVFFSRWENGIIPYNISHAFNEFEVNQIIKAMAHWEESTCIRFKKRAKESDYINIIRGYGCQSFIGRMGGPQGLSLDSSCVKKQRAILHELGHSIGFFHEQNRPDRNENVNVFYDNIDYGIPHEEFEAFTSIYFENHGLPYDYNSIMHYNGDQSSSNGNPTIEAHDKDIPVGLSVVLTELDIIRTNLYYSCPETPPPRTTIYVPLPKRDIPPRPFECGSFISSKLYGTITTPSYPRYQSEQNCSWQILVPQGYRIELFINSFGLKETTSRTCVEGNITLYANLSSAVRVLDTGCPRRLYSNYITRLNEAHILYRSGSKTSDDPAVGFNLSFTAIDINECEEIGPCSHQCINTRGGYSCLCPTGFFLSADSHNCFDINECTSYGKLCEYRCKNFAGHYKCICRDGTIQGLTCNSTIDHQTPLTTMTAPPTAPPPATMTTPPITMTTPPTASPPTTMATTLTAMSTSQVTMINDRNIIINTPNWPETYPVNTDQQWLISCPSNGDHVELNMNYAPFGIAGKMPNCTKDWVRVYDGSQNRSILGQFCYFDMPPVLISTTNKLLVVFHSGPAHSHRRKGFRATHTCKQQCVISSPFPTQLSTYTAINDSNILIDTPNWPETYPVNIDKQWLICCPRDSHVELNFHTHFGIAGRMPNCTKDWVQVYDESQNRSSLGKFCYFNVPPVLISTTNKLLVVFHSGPAHNHRRKGFRATHTCKQQCVISSPFPTQLSTYTAINDSNILIDTPNWPETYPVNIDKQWLICCPRDSHVELNFHTHFGIAGRMPNCTKDWVQVYDESQNRSSLGKFCYFNVPPVLISTTNKLLVVFHAGPAHSRNRKGFRASHMCKKHSNTSP